MENEDERPDADPSRRLNLKGTAQKDRVLAESPNPSPKEVTRLATKEVREVNAKRSEKALQLRAAGFSLSQIAKVLDVSIPAVGEMIRRKIVENRNLSGETAKDLRDIAHMRHETLIARLWLKAMPNDPEKEMDMRAVDRILRIVAQDAKLMGYEAPQKHQIDMSVMQQQVGIVVEAITRVLPDDAIPRVYEAVEEVVQQIERKRALTAATGNE